MKQFIGVPKRPLSSLEHLASAVGLDADFLMAVVERRVDPYRTFELAKASGRGSRKIAAPFPELAAAQRWILDNMLDKADPGPRSFAYQRTVSTKDCAAVHVGARWLVKADLQDFFGSINERRVAKIFRMTGTNEATSVQLAKLCTRVPYSGNNGETVRLGYLPQGSPTSGMLANLTARNLDRSLSRFAWKHQLRYTRYSDDITFSSAADFRRAQAEALIRVTRDHAMKNDFVLNERKTRICPPGSRLSVMGMLVDSDRVRLSTDFKKRLQWHVYGCKRFGLKNYSASKAFSDVEAYILHVHGLFAYALDVDPAWARPLRAAWATNLPIEIQ